MKRLALTVLLMFLAARPFAQSAPAAPEVLGEWELTTVSPVGESTNTIEFRKEGETVKAYAKAPQGERAYDSTQVDGKTVSFVITVDYQGSPLVISYSGTVSEKSINGSADFGGMAIGSFSATRKEPAK